MSLTTQKSPYIMVGNLADLPIPASVPAGYLFHASDTGDCLILIIDPATNVRSWAEFCGATSMTGIQGPALLKWAGGNQLVSAVYFIADDAAIDSNVDVAGISPAYPFARARTALNFAVNLRNRSSVTDVITVDLLANGVVVLSVTFPATALHNGMATAAGPATIPAGAVLNVRVTTPSATRSTQISATLELF